MRFSLPVFSVPLLALVLCTSSLRADSTDSPKHKPDTKLWKSEKEQGETAFKNRRFDEAEEHLKAALAEAENFDAKDYRLAESLTELGDFYARAGKFGEAEPLLQRAADIRHGDPNSLTEASVQFELGFTCQQLRHYEDAEKAFARAQELYSRKFGPDAPLSVRCMFYLGSLYADEQDYAKAEPLLKRSLALFEHPATRLMNHNITDPATHGGNDVWIGRYRPDFAYALEASVRLGIVYAKQNRPADSDSSMKDALRILDDHTGKKDPAVAATLKEITAFCLTRTNYAGAEPFLQRLAALDRKTLGEKAPETLNTENSLAAAYMYEGKYAESETTYKELIATLEKSGGENKFPLIQTLNNYAGLLRKINRDSEAASIEARARKLDE